MKNLYRIAFVTLAFLACVVTAHAQQRAVELVVRDGYAPAHGIISQSSSQVEPSPQNVDYIEGSWWSGEIKQTIRTYRKPNESSSQWAWRHGHAVEAFEEAFPPNPDPSKPLSQQSMTIGPPVPWEPGTPRDWPPQRDTLGVGNTYHPTKLCPL